MSSLVGRHSEPSKTARQAEGGRQGFWTRPPTEVARDLIGWEVLVDGVNYTIIRKREMLEDLIDLERI